MTKVLRIANRFNIGGPTYNVAYLSRFLSDNFETLLIGGEKEESEDSSEFILNQYGIKPIIIKNMKREISPKNDRLAYIEIKKIIQTFKPDIVHTHAAKAGTLGRWAAYKCGVPIIVHTYHGHVFHSYFGKAKTTFYKNIERQLAKITTGIIALSEQQKHEISTEHKICPPDKIKIIPLGFDLERFHTKQEEKRQWFRNNYLLDEDEIAIGIIGRLVPIKNHSLFILAANAVYQQTGKKLRFFIIGDGEEKQNCIDLIKSINQSYTLGPNINIKSNFTFTSWIKEIDYALAGLDIVCLTSLNEGTPVSLIEAQAAGKLIVSTKVGGVENIVLEGTTALLSDNNNLEQYISKLSQAVESKTLKESAKNSGWDWVSHNFSHTRLVKDVENYYLTLLGEKFMGNPQKSKVFY